MGILLCEQNFRDVWRRNKSVRAEIGQILHTRTHAAKLVVEMSFSSDQVTGTVFPHLNMGHSVSDQPMVCESPLRFRWNLAHLQIMP